MKTGYVLGFMFNGNEVALIRKNKPKWQDGMLNGIGGKIEAREDAGAAMVREFKEETGFTQSKWNHFATMSGRDWVVECFMCHGDVRKLESMEEEEVEIHFLDEVPHSGEMIQNLRWLIPMALETDNIFAKIQYK